MNNNDNHLFRQVLQRQNDRAAGMTWPDDMEERVMKCIGKQAGQPEPKNHRWLYATLGAIAAGIVLLLSLGHIYNKVEPTVQQPMTAMKETTPESTTETAIVAVKPERESSKDMPRAKHTAKVTRKESQATASFPDTLGNGIWQNEENVIRAIEILTACEAEGLQRQRNAVVEAVYRSIIPRDGLQLVTSESGDLLIVDEDQPFISEV